MIFTSSSTMSDEMKEELREFFSDSLIEFRDDDVAHLDDEYVFGLERAGRVLRFVTDVDEFHTWLRYVLTSIWGPKTIIDENFSLLEVPDEAIFLKFKSDTMCPDIPDSLQDVLEYDNVGRFNMDSTYMMGARLVVNNAKYQDIIGNSHYKQIEP